MQKDQFDANMELAKFFAEARRARMQTEWQLTFGLWTALGAAAYLGFTTSLPPLFTVLGAILAFVVYWFGTSEFYRRAEVDRLRIDFFINRAQQLANGIDALQTDPPQASVTPLQFLSSPLVRLRLAVTLVGGLLFVVSGFSG